MDVLAGADVYGYYSLGHERDRLSVDARGVLEFEHSTEVIQRHLPAPPAVVADIGGGPGRYAVWLAGRGYTVEHRDLMPLHVEQMVAARGGSAAIRTRVADARNLDLADESADAVLLLGPVYHLRARTERMAALGEARRVVRPGGPVFVAAISRWAPRLDGELRTRLYEQLPVIREVIDDVERTGWMPSLFDGSFTAYCHRPGRLRREVRNAGLAVTDLVSVEGAAFLLGDLDERMADPLHWRVVLDTARATERVPELLGLGPHLLATAIRPAVSALA
jgi:SAM-dependent methyltransferase